MTDLGLAETTCDKEVGRSVARPCTADNLPKIVCWDQPKNTLFSCSVCSHNVFLRWNLLDISAFMSDFDFTFCQHQLQAQKVWINKIFAMCKCHLHKLYALQYSIPSIHRPLKEHEQWFISHHSDRINHNRNVKFSFFFTMYRVHY